MTRYGYSISNNKNKAVEIVFNYGDVEGYISFNFSKGSPDIMGRALERRQGSSKDEVVYTSPYSDLVFKVTPCKIIYVRSISEWGRN